MTVRYRMGAGSALGSRLSALGPPFIAALSIAVTTSCENTTAPERGPSVRVVSGADVQDTIDAILSAPLIVVVRDSAGKLAVDRRVDFVLDGGQLAESRDAGSFYAHFASDNTDAEGRASVFVRLPRTVGSASLIVSVWTLDVADTARYVVRAGNPARLEILPADTALYPQNSFVLRSSVVDRGGNVRQDAISYDAGPLAVAVDASGKVTAGDLGRVYVAARSGTLVDTTWVSIVPRATIAGWFDCSGNPWFSGLGLLELDGSGRRIIGKPGLRPDYPISPSWSPDGTRIVYSSDMRVHITDATGADRLLTDGTGPRVEMIPRYSVDGQWIWYSAGREWPSVDLWRIRSDLTGVPERIGPGIQPTSPNYNLYWQPIAFADNRRVAFLDGGYGMHILDLVTGEYPGITSANAIRYSPVHDLIAYNDESARAIFVMRADGTGKRRVSPAHRSYQSVSVDWSPDGEWLVASGQSATDLINYRTGLVLPLRFTCMPAYVVWRPGS